MDIDELLEAWEEAWEQGQFIPAEQLCADCPELISTVQDRITELLAFSRFEKNRIAADALVPSRRTIGEYTIEGVLGGGGTSVVYRCRHATNGQEAAVKVLNAERMSRDGLARFEREANILRRLDHPSIVRILDVGLTDLGLGPQRFIAMALVRGERLDQFVERHQLPVEHRADLIARIAEAVAYLHAQGVLHRDLKPANVIVNEQQRPIVVDFGLACLDRSDAGDGRTTDTSLSALGTLPYVSPEQLAGHRAHIDFRTDIYSLGVIAYQLVTNRLPIETRGRSLFDIYQQIRSAVPPRADRVQPEVPRGIALVLTKAMAKHPEDRYRTMDDFALDLQRALKSEQTIARTPPPWHLAKRWVERNPRTALSFALITLILSTAAILSSYFARNASVARRDAEQSLRHSISQTRLAEERNEHLRRVAYDLQLGRAWELAPTRPGFVLRSLSDERAFPPDYRSVVWGMTLNYADRVRHQVPHDRPFVAIETDLFSSWVYLIDDQNRIKVWQTQPTALVTTIDSAEKTAPICSISRNPVRQEIVVAHTNGLIQFYRQPTGEVLPRKIEVGESIVNGRYSDDDSYSCVCVSGSVRRFKGGDLSESHRYEPRHASPLAGTTYSPLGHIVALLHANGHLIIHDLLNDRVQDVESPAAEHMAILRNEQQLFLTQGPTTWHMFLGQQDTPRVVNIDREAVIDLSAGGDRKMAYAMASRVSVVYHTRQPTHTSLSLEMDRPVRAASFCHVGQFLTALHPDGTVTIWDTDFNSYRQKAPPYHHPAVLLPLRRSRHLLSGGTEGILALLSTDEMTIERQWQAHDLPIAQIAVNASETLVATHPRQGNVRVWDLATGQSKALFRRPLGHLTSMVFVDGDRSILMSADKGLIFKGTIPGEQAKRLPSFEGANYVVLTADGQTAWVAADNGRIQQWQIEPRRLLREHNSQHPTAHFLALSEDNQRLASVHGNVVLVWRLKPSSPPVRCETPHMTCRRVTFSPDGRTMLTLGSEGILAFWDPDIGVQQLAIDDGARSFEAMAITKDSQHVVTATIVGTIQWWNTFRERPSK